MSKLAEDVLLGEVVAIDEQEGKVTMTLRLSNGDTQTIAFPPRDALKIGYELVVLASTKIPGIPIGEILRDTGLSHPHVTPSKKTSLH